MGRDDPSGRYKHKLKKRKLSMLQNVKSSHSIPKQIQTLRGLPWCSSRNLPANAGGTGLIPGEAAKTPHATVQLSPTTEPAQPKIKKLK